MLHRATVPSDGRACKQGGADTGYGGGGFEPVWLDPTFDAALRPPAKPGAGPSPVAAVAADPCTAIWASHSQLPRV
jgi:hypothetical protein